MRISKYLLRASLYHGLFFAVPISHRSRSRPHGARGRTSSLNGSNPLGLGGHIPCVKRLPPNTVENVEVSCDLQENGWKLFMTPGIR